MQKIAAAKFLGRKMQRGGDLVHLAFQRENTLRRTEAAKRAMRRISGREGAAADAHVGAGIGAGRVNGAARENDGGERGISSSVDIEIDFHRYQFAVACDAGAMTGA